MCCGMKAKTGTHAARRTGAEWLSPAAMMLNVLRLCKTSSPPHPHACEAPGCAPSSVCPTASFSCPPPPVPGRGSQLRAGCRGRASPHGARPAPASRGLPGADGSDQGRRRGAAARPRRALTRRWPPLSCPRDHGAGAGERSCRGRGVSGEERASTETTDGGQEAWREKWKKAKRRPAGRRRKAGEAWLEEGGMTW